MKVRGLNELRELFLQFFETKGHLRLGSFSLVPQNDPSLLLINSGMAPMKPWFTGEAEPPCKRVCTCQKCVRTGDIDSIGHTSRHGTYFEMLGNFSFGDYFKHEAIAWYWEFLTSPDWVGLDPARLYPSVYLEDDEAYNIWRDEIGIAPERIYRLGKEDNFWEHGAGPCGPCSEVYFDRGVNYGCGRPDCAPGCDCDRFMEIGNSVFSQFTNDGNGNYTELKQKNIDFGGGLERLAIAVQEAESLFAVDTLMSITRKVSELTGAAYNQSPKTDVSLRVITDHIRSATMLICDGVLPSNEGRGYVLRRLLRRAARHGMLLGVREPFLYQVCETVIRENAGAYPELLEKRGYITRVIKIEEENFDRTIGGGMKILSELVSNHKSAGETVFSGADAFKLYDTYGFPIDLTVEIVGEQGLTVDRAAFDALMQEQRARARKARESLNDAWAGLDLGLDSGPTRFTGYEALTSDAALLAIVVDGELSGVIREGQSGILVLDRSPFYAEMGGQVADHGDIAGADGVFRVTDVQKDKSGKYLHHGDMVRGRLSVDEAVTACVDIPRRQAVMRAHSATHLLHRALRDVLGQHVEQAGSLVEPDKLRFDFTHFSALTREEQQAVELEVNQMILSGLPVDVREMPIGEARKLGAMALFGEKYGDVVRVVSMGGKSVELCGGTHLDNTAKAGLFRLVSEFSVASGVRRIEAVTGFALLQTLRGSEALLAETAEALKTSPGELPSRARALSAEIREERQTVEKLKDRLFSGDAERALGSAKVLDGLRLLVLRRDGLDTADLRKLGDLIRARASDAVAALASAGGEKISFLAVCGAEAVRRGLRAGEIVKYLAALTGGSGGGKPESAMGGGKDVGKLDSALSSLEAFVLEKLDGGESRQ